MVRGTGSRTDLENKPSYAKATEEKIKENENEKTDCCGFCGDAWHCG